MIHQSKKFIFIINPSSGSRRNRRWEKLISAYIQDPNFEIFFTSYAGHSSSILSHFPSSENLCIVAVGGDGTVSELIPTVLRCNASLGIIPTGSGNGLARHLRIPLTISKAIQKLNEGRVHAIDLIKVNERYSCNTCGIGFSALVTKHFGAKGKRGFSNYLKLALSLYKTSSSFDIFLDEQLYQDVWAVEFANSSQLGNNAIVSPLASIYDGVADVLILKKPNFWQIPSLIAMVLSGNVLKLKLCQLIKASQLQIRLPEEQHYHIDGEYIGTIKSIHLQMIPSVLKVIH